MSNKNNIVQFDMVNEMLDNDPAYMEEFYEAAITSFSQFNNDFQESMRARDMENLRKTGHRIKPVAEMIGVGQISEEYEESKKILREGGTDKQVKASINEVQRLCDQIVDEFRREIEELK